MKLKNYCLIFTQLITILTLYSVNAWAGDSTMICGVTQAISCQKEVDCISGSASDINLPVLLKINPGENKILSVKESGDQKTSVIRQTYHDKDNRFVVYQGVEQGGAWSAAIDTKTGSMTISIAAGESDAYIAFGTCSANL